jgi:hypothetical protein
MREIDAIFLKGKTETTPLFELMSGAGQLTEELARLRECYGEARRMYIANSGIRLRRLSANVSNFVRMMPRRVSSFSAFGALRRNPLGNDWNGVWHLGEK